METAKATLGNFRQAPRKMRLVANMVRGKKVADVLVNLDFTAKKASLPVKTLIQSALANAKSLGIDTDNLVVKTITVNSGKTLQRRQPAARGSAHPIHKRTSSIFVELGFAGDKKIAKIKKEKAVEVSEKPEKKIVSKKPAVKSAKKSLTPNP